MILCGMDSTSSTLHIMCSELIHSNAYSFNMTGVYQQASLPTLWRPMQGLCFILKPNYQFQTIFIEQSVFPNSTDASYFSQSQSKQTQSERHLFKANGYEKGSFLTV